jgi:hypothetical protein
MLKIVDRDPIILAWTAWYIGPGSIVSAYLNIITLCTPYVCPIQVYRTAGEVRMITAIRILTRIAQCSEINRVTPGTGIPVTTMTSHPPFVGGAGLEVIHIEPRLIAISRDAIPRSSGIPPL